MMSLLRDTWALYVREMLIFKKNIITSVARSIILPLVLILILGNMGTSVHSLPIAVVDYSNTQASRSFVNQLVAGRVVSIKTITNQQDALSKLQNGDVAVVLVIPPNFGASGAQVFMYIDSSSPFVSMAVLSYISSKVTSFGASAITYKLSSFLPKLTPNYAYGASASYKTFLVAGIVIMTAAFGAIWSGSMSLILDRQLGNLKAFLAAPINKTAIMLSKVFYALTQAIISGTLALIIGLLDGATIASGISGLPGFFFFMFLTGLGFSSLALLLASRITKTEVYTLLATALVLPLWFLSGAFLPTSTLPSYMQPLSVYNPLTYAVNAVRDIMLKGYISPEEFAFDSTIMIAFAVTMFIIGVIMFKNKIG
jgi:ABC-2 type transport system permease protein